MGALKEELKQEKLRLQNQQERVIQLEEEVKVMQQLKRELSKEQRLRKEAEETLLEILNRGSNLDQDQQRLLQLEPEDCATECNEHESVRTAVSDTDEDSSSLLLGYESRIRRYQLYISKLEKDNLTLIRELQQFKDLSPCSQQEQAKALLGKVTQLERDNQQQQVQYECCLDEVANRLVHTLLAQKHLEEECNALHARVEQLENENQKLLAIVHADEEKVKTLRTSSLSDALNLSERSSDCSTKETFSLLLDVKKSLVREPAKYVSAKHVKTCKVPPTRHQKTLIPEDRVSSVNLNALSASKTASSFDKAELKAHHIHSRILNNQIPSQVNECFKQMPTDASVCPIQKNFSKATTKCSSPNSVPNTSRLRSPTIHLSFKDKAPSATDDSKLSDVKRKRLNRVASEKEIKELQVHGRYPNTSLGKCPRSERNYLHSESSLHLETALQPRHKNAILVDESFSDSDDVFIYTDSPKNFSYDAFCMFPPSRDQQGIYLEDSSGKVFSPVHETDNSVSNDTVHRTRDEGYSTMSSDLQPDSAADTTVSEQDDHSATYIVSEGGQRCSDDSITECLDASMSSSSDSGFGPLHCATGDLLSTRFPNSSLTSEIQFNSENSSACVLVNGCPKVQPVNRDVELQDRQMQSTPKAPIREVTTIIPNGVELRSSQELSHSTKDIHQLLDVSTQSCDSNQRHSSQTEISDFCEDSSNSEATTIIPPHKILKTNQESQSFSCHVNEIIDPPLYSELGESHARSEADFPPCYPVENASTPTEEKTVLTAEKATLTEPEELMWREKALAQYIDESIWSLYSSESDIQIKYSPETFHNQTLEEIPSRPQCLPRSKTHNCITLSEDVVNSNSKNSPNDTVVTNVFKGHPGIVYAENAVTELFNNNVYDDGKVSVSQHSLERVASDTVLHLKTTFHELESSMKSSLKTSKDIANKNIPLVHHLSISDINNRDLSLTPDKDIQLETKFLEKSQKQELTVSNLWWPSPTDIIKSSSLSSLQSSLSYQAVSDEMEDDDVHHISRKGSQDPDLSSASDTDYVNLDHKDFVEQWLQKEITEKHASTSGEGCNSGNTRKTTALRKNIPKYYAKKSQRSFSANQNECNGVPPDHRPLPEDDQCLREMFSESRDAHVRLQSSSLETTPNSLENYYMSEISALYADACASYVEDNYQSKGFAVSLENPYPPYSIKNLSPGLYKTLDGENTCDEYLQCPASEDCDSQSLEPEVKAFNSDFYRLCNLGSLKSLDSFSVGKTDGSVNQDLFQKQLLLSPKFARFNMRKNRELVNQKASGKNSESNTTKTLQTQPVRPTSFTSPLVPCDRKFHSFSKKDSNCKKCDATNVPENTHVFQCSLHHGSQCNCERRSAHLPCSDDSLPAKKPMVNANNIDIHSKLPIRKVTASNKTQYSGDKQEAHLLVSPQKKTGNSPQHRISSRDLLLDYRNDEVSKRQQSRRERWNARRNRMKEGCGTAWIHLQTSADFADPNMRESLLDSVVATSSSDSSSSEDENEYLLSHNTSQLQRICQEKRQKAKAPNKANNLGLLPRRRTSILNCHDIYYRYGQQEQEAIACFDFLEDIPSASESGSLEILQKQASYNANTVQYNQGLGAKGRLKASVYDDLPSTNCSLPSKPSQFLNFSSRLRLPGLWNKPLSHNMSSMTISSQDCEFLDHISLSDSCAESYSSTPDSFEDTSAS